jgi:acyl carrier protein
VDCKSVIGEYISEELNHGVSIGQDVNLIEKRIIDSLGIINLITFLEERFSIKIAFEEVNKKTFGNIESITNLVKNKYNATIEERQ